MQQFVCIRIPKANAIDLTRFQFDFDLTFAIIFLHADGTVYGRYGTRSSREDATHDMSLSGLAEALSGALKLHEGYPANKQFLEGKQPVATKYKTPDEFPSLRGKYTSKLNYNSNVVRSCMHCHQISEAERATFRHAGQPIPDQLLFPFPMPDVIGLKLAPTERAKVMAIEPNSAAAKAGFQLGDAILTLAGQAILSIADVQWVLHNAADTDRLTATVRRNDETMNLTLALENNWRRSADISWRVTSWSLRRMGAGGLVLEELSAADRRKVKLDDDQLALHVTRVGQYGAHAVAKKAGFKQGDVIVSFDGRDQRMSETQLLVYAAQKTKPGDQVAVTVLRAGRKVDLRLRMQE